MTERLTVLSSPASTGAAGNPYIEQLVDHLGRRGLVAQPFTRRALLDRPSVVHVHWPAYLLAARSAPAAVPEALRVLVLLRLARARGAVLVWTGHDVEPHDGFPTRVHAAFFRAFVRQVDHLVALGAVTVPVLRRRWPALGRTPVAVVPHGHYRDVYPPPPSRAQARAALGVPGDAHVLLCFGQVRRYKRLDEVVRAHRRRAGADDLLVVVGGCADEALAGELRAAAGEDPRVRLVLDRVDETTASTWFGAADAFVHAYDDRSALNSGAALLALSLGTPVVARSTPVVDELAASVGGSWVRAVAGDVEDVVVAALAAPAGEPAGAAPMPEREWPAVAAATEEVYRDALRRRRRRARDRA